MFIFTHTVLGLTGSSAVKIPSACYARASGGTGSIRGSGISLAVEGMAPHSSILAWEIPWTEELRGYIPQGRKESDMTEAA